MGLRVSDANFMKKWIVIGKTIKYENDTPNTKNKTIILTAGMMVFSSFLYNAGSTKDRHS
ncbi:unnamed protein product [marine sediment metagenome]|uniref:Uncharacterized protein n=1 Tax=marine sediment metagenome TaxID=412755 RepID=X1VDG7_9ZZZZ